MSSAKLSIKEQDRSVIVSSIAGVSGGITISSRKGPTEPYLVTSIEDLIKVYGEPDPKNGTSMYSAMIYLLQSNSLWVTRALSAKARHAAVMVRSKIDEIPTGVPEASYLPDLIVNPVMGGVALNQAGSFDFPIYSTARIYGLTGVTVPTAISLKTKLPVSTLEGFITGEDLVLSSDSDISTLDPTATKYSILSTGSELLTFDKIRVSETISATLDTEIFKDTSGVLSAYANTPRISRSATNSKEFLIDNADFIAPGDVINIGGQTVIFEEKVPYTELAFFLDLDRTLSANAGDTIFRITQAEFEDRDAFLVVAKDASLGSNDISVGIAPSPHYENAFNIIVYLKGDLIETWEVSRHQELDGFGKQLYLEDKINGKSSYIEVVDNLNDYDNENNPQTPLLTDYSLWRRNSEDQFLVTGNQLAENLIFGHQEIKYSELPSPAHAFTLSDRIKFKTDENEFSGEYKVISHDPINKVFTIDRPLIEDKILRTYFTNEALEVNVDILFFDVTYNDSSTGVVDGIKHYPISKLDKVYYNYALNSDFTISGVAGKLLDAGVNLMLGGSVGSLVTISDVVNSINRLSNSEETPISLFMDGGWTSPAVAIAISQLCQSQGLCHGYLSTDINSELASDYKTAIANYDASLQQNTHLTSSFTGYVKFLDTYNQKEVWISPECFAAASQAFTERNFNMFTPAAGWDRGRMQALDVLVKYSEGDRDHFIEKRINPVRYKKGTGIAIWGNETTLVRPSPMQQRHISMLLITIRTALQALEWQTFNLNNDSTWLKVEASLNAFMRDEIKAKGGVYDYQVALQSIITDSDLDNRRMPIFLGIQPTSDIQMIPVTLAVFNNTVDIQVAV